MRCSLFLEFHMCSNVLSVSHLCGSLPVHFFHNYQWNLPFPQLLLPLPKLVFCFEIYIQCSINVSFCGVLRPSSKFLCYFLLACSFCLLLQSSCLLLFFIVFSLLWWHKDAQGGSGWCSSLVIQWADVIASWQVLVPSRGHMHHDSASFSTSNPPRRHQNQLVRGSSPRSALPRDAMGCDGNRLAFRVWFCTASVALLSPMLSISKHLWSFVSFSMCHAQLAANFPAALWAGLPVPSLSRGQWLPPSDFRFLTLDGLAGWLGWPVWLSWLPWQGRTFDFYIRIYIYICMYNMYVYKYMHAWSHRVLIIHVCLQIHAHVQTCIWSIHTDIVVRWMPILYLQYIYYVYAYIYIYDIIYINGFNWLLYVHDI